MMKIFLASYLAHTHFISTVVKKVSRMQGNILVKQLNIQKWEILKSFDSSARLLKLTCVHSWNVNGIYFILDSVRVESR